MAVISGINWHIDRSSYPAGSICTVRYQYFLTCDPAEIRTKIGFSVWCELWGKDVLVDDVLGDLIYDTHTLAAEKQLMISRHFNVPCKVLDEDIGTDEIYIKVSATTTLGHTISAISDIVRDRF